MKRILFTIPFILFGTLGNAQDIDLDEVEKKIKPKMFAPAPEAKVLSLHDAISQGLRLNNQEKIRSYRKGLIELNWKDAFEGFWFPQLNLTVNTSGHHVQSIYSNENETVLSETPAGFVGLEFEDYTVFNWGRDYLKYLNQKATYIRENQILKEQRRDLRFKIIDKYFNLSLLKQIRLIKKSQLRHTSFIYKLSKEKLSLGRINKQALLQGKEEFLRAHQEFQDINAQVATTEQDLATLLGDDLSTTYTLTNQLKFSPLNIQKDETITLAQQRSPQLRQANVELANANRSFEKNLKDNLPLPKFTVRLGAYRHSFSNQGSQDSFTTYGNENDVEVAASINMKWRIFGSGGFLNSREREREYFNKRIAEIEFTEAKRDVKVAILTFHKQISHLEKKVEAAKARLKNARVLFDATLDRYISGQTSFPDVSLALDSLINTQEAYEEAKYEHLAQKLNLANLAGVDDFPGEKFDNLVMK